MNHYDQYWAVFDTMRVLFIVMLRLGLRSYGTYQLEQIHSFMERAKELK